MQAGAGSPFCGVLDALGPPCLTAIVRRTMNAADLATVIAFFGCAIAACIAADSGKTGWFTVLFIALGLGIGLGAGYCVRRLGYFLLDVGASRSKAWAGWLLIIIYMLAPLTAALVAVLGTGALIAWLVRHTV